MPCYQPLLRAESKTGTYMNKDGKLSHIAHIYSLFDSPFDDYQDVHDTEDTKWQKIPCGQCIGCRLEYSRQWADRGYLESLLHEQNYFITLTYDNEHLPMNDFCTTKEGKIYVRQDDWTGTLRKRDLQLFFKRLRNEIPKFLYLACGEYGSKNGRPHYHAILFGAELPTETFYNPRIINNEYYYQNDIIEKCWTEETGKTGKRGKSLGFSNISNASWNTIAYTARYVVKKQTGTYADEEMCKLGREREFITVSKKPAIGKEWFNLNHVKCMDEDRILIVNTHGAYETKRPRYFDKLMEKYNEEWVQEDKERRREKAIKANDTKMARTSLTEKEQLMIEERSQQLRTKQLKENLDSEPVTKGRDSWKRQEERPRPRFERT